MEKYPELVTERFDNANFHIKYCLKFIKKYLKGDILEVGGGVEVLQRIILMKQLIQLP